MLTKCDFNNVDGSHSYSFNDVQSPLNLFDPTVAVRIDTSRNKLQLPGVNPTKPYRGGMELHMEGLLFAESSSAYFTERQSIMLALYGDPNTPPDPTERIDGTLVIRLDGATEDWEADCAVTAFTAPLKGNYPALTEYGVTFFSWKSWFIGSSSGDFYYYS